MSKILIIRKLRGQRSLLAMCLISALSLYGCTTDRSLGNGDPTDRPGLRTTPTSGMPTGSETGVMPPPMTSSYTQPGELQSATRRPIRRLSPEEAALIVADQQFQQSRFRVLGPLSPATPGQRYTSANVATGQFVNPAMLVNPQMTVNSSISSPSPGVAITSGAGSGTVATGTTIVGGITADANDLALGSPFVDSPAPVFLPTETRPVPSNIAPETGTGGLVTTGAGNPLVPTSPSGRIRQNAPAPTTSGVTTGSAHVLGVPATGGTSSLNGLRVMTNASGRVTVTNQRP